MIHVKRQEVGLCFLKTIEGRHKLKMRDRIPPTLFLIFLLKRTSTHVELCLHSRTGVLSCIQSNILPCETHACSIAGTLMFTALGSFFNRISDPEMGTPPSSLASPTSLPLRSHHFARMRNSSHLNRKVSYLKESEKWLWCN